MTGVDEPLDISAALDANIVMGESRQESASLGVHLASSSIGKRVSRLETMARPLPNIDAKR
jgi:hypothetical protein